MTACGRCGATLSPAATECHACGLPTAFMDAGSGTDQPQGEMSKIGLSPIFGGRGEEPEVIEPEIVGGFDPGAAGRGPAPGSPMQVGCTLGPGCGCLAIPLAVVGAVVAASALAFAWLLRIGETVGAAVEMIARALGGRGRGPRGGPPAR